MKRMQHPEHGFHHCYTPQEEEVMRSNGWVDENDDHNSLIAKPVTADFPPLREKIRGNRRGTR